MKKSLKVLRPCLGGCGRLTQRLYYPGCDSKVRAALTGDMVDGNPDAARVLATLADASVPHETKRRVYAEYRAMCVSTRTWALL